jgi:membrane protein YqaA with SNARE-associated domain
MESATALDRFVGSRAAQVAAFAWGLAEATVFFIVPDVLLSLLGCRRVRPAIRATVAALAGAISGGVLMYALGAEQPRAMLAFLDRVPAISPALIESVASEIDERGAWAVMTGPLKGIPYKIYAVEWGARRGSLLSFFLISIPARYMRFFLSAAAARGIAHLISRWTDRRVSAEMTILAVVWIGFYAFYFSRFGW